ncbi:PorV/PorQ family protein [Candidatus Margulisiibacteriota bacterium]
MIRSGGRIFISILILIVFSIQGFALGVGTTGANYLKIDTGARSSALGSAYVGLADDLNALYWNPAGIAHFPYAAIDTMQLNWLAGISQQQISGVYPLGNFGVIGGYYSSLTTPYDRETTYSGNNYYVTGKSFNSEIKLINLTYAKKLSSKLSIGLGLKRIEERLFDVKKEGLGLDAGLLYQGLILPDLSLGLVLQNYSLTPLRSDEPLPQTVILGAAYSFKLLGSQRLTVLGDISFPVDNDKYYGIGVEYELNRYLAFRIGYKDKVGTTLGGGLSFGQLKLNYAYVPYGDLGSTYRVSVGYDFGNDEAIFREADKKEEEKIEMPKTDAELFEEKKEEIIETTQNIEVEVKEENIEEVDIEEEEEVTGSVNEELDDLFADK